MQFRADATSFSASRLTTMLTVESPAVGASLSRLYFAGIDALPSPIRRRPPDGESMSRWRGGFVVHSPQDIPDDATMWFIRPPLPDTSIRSIGIVDAVAAACWAYGGGRDGRPAGGRRVSMGADCQAVRGDAASDKPTTSLSDATQAGAMMKPAAFSMHMPRDASYAAARRVLAVTRCRKSAMEVYEPPTPGDTVVTRPRPPESIYQHVRRSGVVAWPAAAGTHAAEGCATIEAGADIADVGAGWLAITLSVSAGRSFSRRMPPRRGARHIRMADYTFAMPCRLPGSSSS